MRYMVEAKAVVESSLPLAAVHCTVEDQLRAVMDENWIPSDSLTVEVMEIEGGSSVSSLTPEQKEENLRAVINGADQGPHRPERVEAKRGLLSRLTGKR